VKEKSINKLVGEHLRLIRLSKNLNLEVLSEDLGVSLSTLSNMERGETEVSVSRLFQLLKILEYDVLLFFQEIIQQYENGDSTKDLRFAVKANKAQSSIESEIEWIKKEIEKLKNS
jgi:transcriptional regulator with XRE-family HTH domain